MLDIVIISRNIFIVVFVIYMILNELLLKGVFLVVNDCSDVGVWCWGW